MRRTFHSAIAIVIIPVMTHWLLTDDDGDLPIRIDGDVQLRLWYYSSFIDGIDYYSDRWRILYCSGGCGSPQYVYVS